MGQVKMKHQNEYENTPTLTCVKQCGSNVRVYRPIITPEENQRRLQDVASAISAILKYEVEIIPE